MHFSTSVPYATDVHRNAGLSKELKEVHKSLEEMKKKNASLVEENKNLTRALSRELGEGMSSGTH